MRIRSHWPVKLIHCSFILIYVWSTVIVCGKPEKRPILLCYHSRDEGNVKKFLKSLHNIGADVTCKNELSDREDDETYQKFREGIVLICLSKEYAVDPSQEKGQLVAFLCISAGSEFGPAFWLFKCNAWFSSLTVTYMTKKKPPYFQIFN